MGRLTRQVQACVNDIWSEGSAPLRGLLSGFWGGAEGLFVRICCAYTEQPGGLADYPYLVRGALHDLSGDKASASRSRSRSAFQSRPRFHQMSQQLCAQRPSTAARHSQTAAL